MGKADDRTKMETNPAVPPFMRRWAAEVNAAITQGGGPGWATTTTTTSTTTTTA